MVGLFTLSSMTWCRQEVTLVLMISDIIFILRESHRLSKGYAFPWAREMGTRAVAEPIAAVPAAAFGTSPDVRQTSAEAGVVVSGLIDTTSPLWV